MWEQNPQQHSFLNVIHFLPQVSLERRKRDLEAEVQAEVAASQQQPAATSTTSLPAATLSEQGR